MKTQDINKLNKVHIKNNWISDWEDIKRIKIEILSAKFSGAYWFYGYRKNRLENVDKNMILNNINIWV